MEYLIVCIVCAFGSFLNILCGFGIGVVCMMFLTYVMHSTTGPAAVVNLVTAWQAAWFSWTYRRYIRWKIVLPALAGYVIAAFLAVRLSVKMDFQTMKKILGVFLLGLSVYLLFLSDKLHLRPTAGNGFLSGLVGGVSSGLFAVGGPPAALYFSATSDDKQTYLANLQAFFCLSNIYVIGVRAINGIITPYVLLCAAAGLVGMVLGSFLGKRAFDRANEKFILRAIYGMMAVSGVMMLVP